MSIHQHIRKSKKNSTLQFRVNDEDKQMIQQAAYHQGLDVSDYLRALALKSAREEVYASQTRICLNEQEWQRFLSVMESMDTPNEKLKQAFEDYKKDYKI